MSEHNLEAMVAALEATGDYRVMRRFQPRAHYWGPSPSGVSRGLIVDVETTGLDAATDRIIEFGAVPFDFDSEGRVYTVHEPLSYFEDPERPIPTKVVELTGITDDMVRGHRIDDEAVHTAIAQTQLVIAHNADFDRKFLERRFPDFASKHWACSLTEVPWDAFGIGGRKLEYLLFKGCGEFHTGHRATDDCLATLHVLVTPKNGEQWPLAALLPRARKKVFRLWAPDTSYDVKGQLRDRGWRWHSGSPKRPKSWYFDGETEIAAQEEKAWVEANGYIGRPPRTSIELLTGKERYSERAE